MNQLKRRILNLQILKQGTLNDCKVFSVVDMSNCYWHQKLTEESLLYFSVCSIRFLADIDLRECHLVFHAQVKWPTMQNG